MAARDKLQDEQNLKSLRELVALPPNKHCFDCRQRGPTYVNITIGSFVCTSCSGILRGLNPPHRVKSITMAKFTSDEIQVIKGRGNEYCRHVWLGKYDMRPGLEPDSQNAQKVRDFLIQKYEGKKWYVDPEIAVHQMQQQTISFSSNLAQEVKVQNTTVPSFNQEPKVSSWTPATPTSGDDNTNLSSDVFAGFNSDPFASPRLSDNAKGDAFADFSSAFGNVLSSNAKNQDTATSGTLEFSSSIPAFDVSSASNDTSKSSTEPILSTHKKQAAPPPPDRYAALADLDLEWNQSQSTAPTPIWSGTGTSSSLFGGPAVFSSYNSKTAESSNPFGTTSTWSNTNAIPSANPFQGISQPQPAVLQNFPQYTKPTAPSFSTSNALPNGGDVFGMQNGITPSPWGLTSGSVTLWDTGLKNGQGIDTFQGTQVNQRSEPFNPWSQTQPNIMSGANPFTNGSGAINISANVPRLNPGNPFL